MMWFEEALASIEKRGGAKVAEEFRAAGLPGPKTEGWQHAGLRQFFMTDRHLLETDSISPSNLPVTEGPCIVLWNGKYLADRSMLPDGVTVQAQESVTPSFVEGAIFHSLAGSLAAHVHIEITKPQSTPLHVVSYVEGILPSFICQSLGIFIETGAQAEVLMSKEVIGHDPGHLLCTSMYTEVMKDARLSIADVPGGPLTGIESEVNSVCPYSTYERFLLGRGKAHCRTDLKTNMGTGATVNIFGLFLQKEGNSSVHAKVNHIGGSSSTQAFRSSVFGDARTSFDITTEVGNVALGTEAVQESRHLLLGKNARAFTVPRLVINTDDVQCKHGATVGHADKEQLAYMRARGLGDQRARSLLAYGHLASLLEQYPDTVRPQVDAELRTHLLLS